MHGGMLCLKDMLSVDALAAHLILDDAVEMPRMGFRSRLRLSCTLASSSMHTCRRNHALFILYCVWPRRAGSENALLELYSHACVTCQCIPR